MKKKGFISTIVLIIAAILLLKFWFDIDILTWIKKPEVSDFFIRLSNFISLIWENYLRQPFQITLAFVNDFISKNF